MMAIIREYSEILYTVKFYAFTVNCTFALCKKFKSYLGG